ncbi:ribonuclease H [Senna tora]|uniref:Ribonuclease H n=1 Tax=Senna tora TaxID=362788 RepID=A0A834TUR9_9FABA|nr:ribonuclease H [Senna tora]
MLHNAENQKWLKGIQFGCKGPQISHLMYADDTVLFFKADEVTNVRLNNLLDEFCMMVGQKINRNKSLFVFSPNSPAELKEGYREEWRIEFRNNLGKYLGTYVDGRLNSHCIYEELLEKIQSRLAGWKSKLISQAGRVTLINSVLQALPIYQMSNGALPKKVSDKIESITNNFFWGIKSNGYRIHLLKSEALRQPKWKGGLGFKNINCFNKALLAKNVWRLIERPNTLLSRWFLGKYQDPSKELDFKKTSQDSLYWKNIVKSKNLVIDNLKWTVGNGEYIRTSSKFWPFKGRNNDQDLLIADFITKDGEKRWNTNALMRFYNRSSVNEITQILLPYRQCPDVLAWKINKEGIYTVKDGYRTLQNMETETAQGRNNNFPWNWFWKLNMPHRILLFIWKLMNHALPTSIILKQHHVPVVDTKCGLCGTKEETLSHLFLTCDFSRAVWFGMNTAFRSTNLTNADVHDWIREMCLMTKDNLLNSTDLLRIFTCLENIWFYRNKMVMESTAIDPTNCILRTENQVQNFKEACLQGKNIIYQMENNRSTWRIRQELIEPEELKEGLSFSIIRLKIKKKKGWLGVHCVNGVCSLIIIFWPDKQWSYMKSMTFFLWKCMVKPTSMIHNLSSLNLPSAAKVLKLDGDDKVARSEDHNLLREIRNQIIRNRILVKYCNDRWNDIAKYVTCNFYIPLGTATAFRPPEPNNGDKWGQRKEMMPVSKIYLLIPVA